MEADIQKKLHASGQDHEDVQRARSAWRQALPMMEVEKLVCIDETWTSTGMTRRCRLTAPLVTDGPMEGEIFVAYVRQFLCPTLQPGDTVILDNLSSHKVEGVEAAIMVSGARVGFLPPCSPDLNPIEKLFSKLKARLRKAAVRDIETLWKEIGELLNTFSAIECTNLFNSREYVST